MMIHPTTNLHHYPSIRLPPSIYLPIHSLNYLSIYSSIYLSIYLSIHSSIYSSIHLFIYLSIYPYTHRTSTVTSQTIVLSLFLLRKLMHLVRAVSASQLGPRTSVGLEDWLRLYHCICWKQLSRWFTSVIIHKHRYNMYHNHHHFHQHYHCYYYHHRHYHQHDFHHHYHHHYHHYYYYYHPRHYHQHDFHHLYHHYHHHPYHRVF